MGGWEEMEGTRLRTFRPRAAFPQRHYGPEATPTKKKVLEDPKVVLIRPRPPLSPKKFQNRAIGGF